MNQRLQLETRVSEERRKVSESQTDEKMNKIRASRFSRRETGIVTPPIECERLVLTLRLARRETLITSFYETLGYPWITA